MTRERKAAVDVAVVGSDADVVAAVAEAAVPLGAGLVHLRTLTDKRFVGRLRSFRLLVLDAGAADERAGAILELVSRLPRRLPVVVVRNCSGTPASEARLPACVRSVIDRSSGLLAVRIAVERILCAWRVEDLDRFENRPRALKSKRRRYKHSA